MLLYNLHSHSPLLPAMRSVRMRSRLLHSDVSACFGSSRTFSPLCFTDSGFNSDSTQYPADRCGHKQVCSFKLQPFPAQHCMYTSSDLYIGRRAGSFHLFSMCFFPLDGSSAWLYVLLYVRSCCMCMRIEVCVWRRRALQLLTRVIFVPRRQKV